MTNAKPFLLQTAETASFAFREFFRPILVMVTFFKDGMAAPKLAESTHKCDSLEDAKAILRQRLARGRYHEKILLMQGMLSALASVLALAISLMHAFDVELAVVLAILVPASTFTVWVALRLVHNREEIVELKTIRWLMKSVDEETAESLVRQVLWGKPKGKQRSKKEKETI